MFYFLIDKYLNDYLGQDSENRAFKIYVFGTLLYLLLHVLVYSSLCDNYSIIIKYRHYIYYLMLIDALATYMFGNKTNNSNTEDEKQEDDENKEEEKEEILPSNQRLTRQEIINKFLVKKQNEKVRQEHDKDSISINSNDGSSKSEKKEVVKQQVEVKQEIKEEVKQPVEVEMKEEKEELVLSDTDLLSYKQ